MSKVLYQEAAIYTSSIGGTLIGIIPNVVVDGLNIDKSANEVTIDQGHMVNESFTQGIELRTTETNFEAGSGSSAGLAILSDATVSTDGSDPTTAYLELVGRGNALNFGTGALKLNGYEDYSNNRLETVLEATFTEIKQNRASTSIEDGAIGSGTVGSTFIIS